MAVNVLIVDENNNIYNYLFSIFGLESIKAIHSTSEEDALKILPHIDLIGTRLYQRTTYRRSFSEGLAVFELEPKGKAAAEVNKFACMVYPS